MSKVLLSGANGFLAGNILGELLKRGYHVRGMIRKTAHIITRHRNLEIFYGNITDEADVIEAARGCEIIIHSAALTNQSVSDKNIYESINVGGTGNIIKAATLHRTPKIIYVSTANVFGHGSKSAPGHEGLPMSDPFSRSGYAKSKSKAQTMILEAFKKTNTMVKVVNPTFMIGPNDQKISSNRIILRALGKKFVLIPPGGKNFIHVGDVANATCNAIDGGKTGECYILAHENLTYREFYLKMSRVTGKRLFLITIPGPFLLLAGLVGDFLRLAGVNTSVTFINMKIICLCNYYTSRKAIKEIHLRQTPVEKGIADAISWFRNQKG